MTTVDFAVAHRYADAYAGLGPDTPGEPPAPHLQLRQVNPGGHHIATAPPISITDAGREYRRKHQRPVTVRNASSSFRRG